MLLNENPIKKSIVRTMSMPTRKSFFVSGNDDDDDGWETDEGWETDVSTQSPNNSKPAQRSLQKKSSLLLNKVYIAKPSQPFKNVLCAYVTD